MAGIAGELIGLGANSQPAIAQAQALVDGTTSARGCTTNFIGFGLGAENQVQTNSDTGDAIEDFNAADDTVTLALTAGSSYEPTYTADVLSWEEVIPRCCPVAELTTGRSSSRTLLRPRMPHFRAVSRSARWV